MEAVAIVTSLALLQVALFSFQVGAARQKHGVHAPSITGNAEFERVFRVHQNTIEQLIMVIPGLWMFAYFLNPNWAAGVGVVFIISRFMYSSAYSNDPSKRSLSFTIGFISTMALVIGGMVGAVMTLLDK